MLESIFSNPGFMPHIHCYLGQASLIWTMVTTDTLVGLAYVSISLTLWWLVRKIQLPFSFVILCFGLFIGACGATHFLEIWTLWRPDYWLAAGVKGVTAVASVGTGIYLFRLRHVIVAFAETARLSNDRKRDLESLAADLEGRIANRTNELENLNARFERVSRSTDLGVWYCDLPFDKLIWNDKTKEHFWMPASKQVTIDDFYEHIHPDDRERTENTIANSIKNRIPYEIEYRTVHPETPDKIKFIRAVGWTDYAPTGEPIRFDGITFDLTESRRKEIERETLQAEAADQLQISESNFRTITETMPQIVWSSSADGTAEYFNRRWYEFTGLEQSYVKPKRTNLFHPEDEARVISAWEQSVQNGTNYEIEFRLKHRDGGFRWVLARALPVITARGKIKSWLGTLTDVHDQRSFAEDFKDAKENAERANKLKTLFLTNISHEIRTPLGAILGFSELLSKAVPDGSLAGNYIERINRNSVHLSRLLDEILDLSKIEADRLEVELKNFDPRSAIEDALSTISHKAEIKNLEVTKYIDPLLPSRIHSDPTRFRQILINLLGNAVKFTESGGIVLHVEVESGSKPRLNIRVSDSGIGLTSEQSVNLFSAFNQGDNSISRRFGGTGLGLAISRELAVLLGGTLILETSSLGAGSVFLLTLPLAELAKNPEANIPVLKTSEILLGKEILAVDDSPDNLELVARFLESTGATITTAENGREAILKITQKKFDLILLDLQMPVADGYQTVFEIRQNGLKLPVIALTAHALKAERDKALSSGFNGYLTKPIDRTSLIAMISSHVGESNTKISLAEMIIDSN